MLVQSSISETQDFGKFKIKPLNKEYLLHLRKGVINIIRYGFNRLWQSIVLIALVSLITFFLTNLAPGGPSSIMRIDTTVEEREILMERMGLDQPVIVRYGQWLKGAVKGDFGASLSSSEPVIQRIMERFPVTITLTFL